MYIPGPIVDSELYAGCFDTAAFMTATAVVEDRFETMPVLPAAPAFQPANEEELHTSFEQAISDRLLAINKQLNLISGPLAHTQGLHFNTEFPSQSDAITYVKLPAVPVQQNGVKLQPTLLVNAWQRNLVFSCLALMFILTGFDLMGLLMLYIR